MWTVILVTVAIVAVCVGLYAWVDHITRGWTDGSS